MRLSGHALALAVWSVYTALAASAPLAAAEDPPPPVKGSLSIGGKPLELRHAWLVRGPDSFDEKRMRTYVIMTPDDVSKGILACDYADCALFDQVKAGLVLGIDPEGFWLRAVHPDLKGEKQFSGPVQASYGWKPGKADSRDRAAGRLTCPYEPIVCDLEIDAKFLKEFRQGHKK